jgi:hypothetical protein
MVILIALKKFEKQRMRRKWEEGSRGKERRGEREGKKGQSKEMRAKEW